MIWHIINLVSCDYYYWNFQIWYDSRITEEWNEWIWMWAVDQSSNGFEVCHVIKLPEDLCLQRETNLYFNSWNNCFFFTAGLIKKRALSLSINFGHTFWPRKHTIVSTSPKEHILCNSTHLQPVSSMPLTM